MASKRLLAAVTASVAILWLNVPASGHSAIPPGTPLCKEEAAPLAIRVEHLREKLGLFNADDAGKGPRRIDNIVQFFNFYNCMRPGWRNC
jgi:hypothetical protein